jgi:2,3-bisphosphoglycerate-dependent phosphoglycerate mutase
MNAPRSTSPGKLVMIRHGQSDWNLKNLFTGWTDVDLTEQGRSEARAGARTLIEEGLEFDIAFTSVLTRAIRTLWIMLDEMNAMWLPVERHWRLNERHYGALQGLDKAETAARHGADQVKIWRRSYDIPPPALEDDDSRHPRHDPRYRSVAPSALPGTESLKTTLDRVRPYWEDRILPELRVGRNVLVAAHGNSLRALVKMLENISDADITEFNIPTGAPRIYEFDADMNMTRGEYLGDAEAIAAAAKAVAEQASAGPR